MLDQLSFFPEIKNPFSIWLQISSFSFFLAGNFSDLLIIRICLSSAYVFLFLNSVMGAPLWPSLRLPDKIQLDAVCWAILNLYVHISTVVRLLNDERSVILEPDELHSLWRMFYRTGGLSQMMFKKCVGDYCTVVAFAKDSLIPTDEYFYIIYKGTVKIHVVDEQGRKVSSRKAQSGQLFDFRALGLLQDMQSLSKHKIQTVVAITDCTLFQFPREEMPRICLMHATRLMWKELLMENLLRIVQRYFERQSRQQGYTDSPDYLNPMFLPLQDWEQPEPLRAGSGVALRSPFRHVFYSGKLSFAPPWPFKGPPMGLRHSSLPAPGRVQHMPPKKLLDQSESQYLMSDASSANTTGYGSSNNTSFSSFAASNGNTPPSEITGSMRGEEDEEFLEYMLEIDEEMGGMNLVEFRPV
jgi:hypothetical protein